MTALELLNSLSSENPRSDLEAIIDVLTTVKKDAVVCTHFELLRSSLGRDQAYKLFAQLGLYSLI